NQNFHVELYDVEEDPQNAVGVITSIQGAIDGGVVESGDDIHCWKLDISTYDYMTYTCCLPLHIDCKCETFTAEVTLQEATRGYRNILDQEGPLFVFAYCSKSSTMGFVRDIIEERTIHLRRNEAIPSTPGRHELTNEVPYQPNHGTLDILYRDDVIAVARYRTMDLYSTLMVRSALQSHQSGATIPDITPFQSILYPGTFDPLYEASFLRKPNQTLSASPNTIVLVSADFTGCYGLSAAPTPTSNPSSPATFTYEQLGHMAQPVPWSFCVVWGPSGKLFATLSESELAISYTVKGQGKLDMNGTTPENYLARWEIPARLADVPLVLDFDETTGTCVAVMACGRTWVKRSSTFPKCSSAAYPASEGLASESPETAREVANPVPEPVRWPIIHPLPLQDGVSTLSAKPHPIAPGWSDEVAKYFPHKNQVGYYGGTPWFVHEVARIPIRHYFSKDNARTSAGEVKEGWAKTVLFSISELNDGSYFRGYDEVIEVHPLPGATGLKPGFWLLQVESSREWNFYKLRRLKGVNTIVEYLRKPGAHIEYLCERRPFVKWPIDQTKLDQFVCWRLRSFEGFGRPETIPVSSFTPEKRP
ncbi:hypothetical protein FRB90_000885, partial [Tulasnella sp. 427]